MEFSLPLDNGKYTVEMKDSKITAKRNGLPWRDLTGDNLFFYMLMHSTDLECRMIEVRETLNLLKSAETPSKEIQDSIEKLTKVLTSDKNTE